MRTSNAVCIFGIECCEQGLCQQGVLFIELFGIPTACRIDEG